ncbi:MAG: hypothetical protein WAN60_20450 [Candidatus Sulfotelmatobacter sp.]
MSETPESTPANVPPETQASQQPELCFGEIETQNEMQLEMRFETEESRTETPNETPLQTQNGTRVETRVETPVELQPVALQNEATIELQDETPVLTQIETPVALQSETRIEKQIETPIVMQAEAPVETQTEARVEIQNEKAPETPAVTRPEPQAVTLNDRPFRVKLRGSVLVLIRLPNKRQLRAALHQLSTTGGVINLEKPLDEKIEVELIFHIDRSTIRGKAQMLFPMWATQGWMQPFRFVELADTDRNALQENLQSFIGNLAKGASAAS